MRHHHSHNSYSESSYDENLCLKPPLLLWLAVLSLCRRVPNASEPVRRIWANGRILLAISAAADLVLSSISLIQQGEVDDQALMSLLAAAADAYFLLYILAARRVRDAFSEFPPPLDPVQK